MAIRLQLFGPPTVVVDGEAFVLPCERRSQLLVMLALKRAWMGRAELAAVFWPEQPDKLAFANLRKTLFRLQAVPWGGCVEAEGGAVRVDAATDVADVEAALAATRTADAVALRTGELLAGFDDAGSEAWQGWLGFERDRLRAAWRGAALARLGEDLAPAEGVELSARLLDEDPLDEAALRAHMAWLARAGQGTRARHAYQAFVARLASELGLAPGADLAALHDRLGTASVAAVAAAPGAGVPADRDFVGRTVELKHIGELLGGAGCRLLNLVGPGGAGKTRLAQRALAELSPSFPDGTAFVPLEDVAAADRVGARIAHELGVELKRGADAEAQVIDHLRGRRMLLALDNFEHVADAAPVVERLLRACAGLAVIVTSRVRLGIASEHLLRIDGLPCPEPEDADHVESFDAARLFTQAARRVEPALVPAAEAAAIVDICRAVDGLPLALELAAAWTRVLSCTAIAAELRRSAELLRSDDAGQPERHASIEAVFDRSWRLLAPVERDALARLSVFHGGFAADAARAVAGAPLPVLGALADKSLLRKDGPRMNLHPLVHQFAAARLAGEARTAAEAAHARHFHRMLAQVARAVGYGDRDTMRQVDAEFENCRAAWHWAVARGERDLLRRSESALSNYCAHRLRNAEGLALMRDALAADGVRGDPAIEAHLLARAAHFEYRLDRYADAEALAVRAQSLLRAGRDRMAELMCLNVLGSCALRTGRYAEAGRHYRRSLEVATTTGDPTHVAAALDHVGLVEKALGHYDESLRLSLQSLLAHRRSGDAAGEAMCLNNLGDLHMAMGRLAAAAPYLRDALALCDRLGIDGPRLYTLNNLAEVAVAENDLAAAEGYARRGLELAVASGNRTIEAALTLQFAQIARLRGDLAQARARVAEGLALVVSPRVPMLQFAGVILFAELLAAAGEAGCAHALIAFVAGHPDVSAPVRDEANARRARLPPARGPVPAWPGLSLEALIDRIVGEAPLAHAPLLAALRGTA